MLKRQTLIVALVGLLAAGGAGYGGYTRGVDAGYAQANDIRQGFFATRGGGGAGAGGTGNAAATNGGAGRAGPAGAGGAGAHGAARGNGGANGAAAAGRPG